MMKRKSRKLCSLIVASSMVLSMSVSPVLGAQFEDTADHWASKQINTWSDYGVINGYEGLFRPNDPITRGEMAVIMDNIMQYRVKGTNTFKDLDYGFYRDAILKASNAGVMNGSDGLVRPKDNITREESAILICNTMGIDPSDSSSQTFDDSGDIASWAKPYVNALLNKGYISGKGDNNFDPQGYITRGETVTILDNIVKGFYNSAGTYTQNADGTVVVNSADAVLKNMNITGDLIISEGVGDGDIILEDVTLGGTLIVRGGGENSIHFRGSKTQVPNVKMEKKDGNVRLATDGQAKVGNVFVKDKSKEVKLEGTYNSVTVSSTNTVRIQKANITKVSLETEKSILRVDNNSTLETLEVLTTAESSELYVEGNVKTLQASAKSIKIQTTTSSTIETFTLAESASNADVTLGGKVTNTTISASDTKFVVNKSAIIASITISTQVVGMNFEVNGTITTLTTNGTDIKINVFSTATIKTITASESSSNTTISGPGKVEQVYANGNAITITTGGTQVTTGSNATDVVVNNTKVESNTTIVTTGQNGGITNPTDNNNSGSNNDDVAAGARRIISEITSNQSAFNNVRLNDNVLDIAKDQARRAPNYADYNIELVEPSANINSAGTAIGIGSASVGFKATHKDNSKNTYTTANKITFNISPQENATVVNASVYEPSTTGFTIKLDKPVTGINITVKTANGIELLPSAISEEDGGLTYKVTGNFEPGSTLVVSMNKMDYSFNQLTFQIPTIKVTANLTDNRSTESFEFKLSQPVDGINIAVNGKLLSSSAFSTSDYGTTYTVTGPFEAGSNLIVTISKSGYEFNTLNVPIPNAGETTASIESAEAIDLTGFTLKLSKAVSLDKSNIKVTTKDGTEIVVKNAVSSEGGLTYTVTTDTLTANTTYTVVIDKAGYSIGSKEFTTGAGEVVNPDTEVTATVTNSSTTGFTIELSTPVEGISITIDGVPTTSFTFTTNDNGNTYNVTGNFTPDSTLTVVITKDGYTFNTLEVKIPAGQTNIKTTANISTIETLTTNTFKITFVEPVTGLSPEDITVTPVGGGTAIEIGSAAPSTDNLTYTIVTKADLAVGDYDVSLDATKYTGIITGTLTVEETDKVTVTLNGAKHTVDKTVWYGVYGNTVNNTVGNAVYARVYLKPEQTEYTIAGNRINLNFDVLSEIKVSNPNPELELNLSDIEFELLDGTSSLKQGIKVNSTNNTKMTVEINLTDITLPKEFTLKVTKIGQENIAKNNPELKITVTKVTTTN